MGQVPSHLPQGNPTQIERRVQLMLGKVILPRFVIPNKDNEIERLNRPIHLNTVAVWGIPDDC